MRVFETYGRQLAPKVVLVGLFPANDMDDAELFDRWWREARNEDFRHFRSSGSSGSGPYAWLKAASTRSYVAALLNQLRAVHYQGRFLSGTTIDLAPGERVQIVPQFHANNVANAVPGKPGFDLMIDAMAELEALAASQGTACLVVLFPSKEEIYGQFTDQEFPDLAAPVRSELEARGVDYVDLGPLFRERARDGLALHHEVDGHPNARGYALIAATLADHLQQNASKYGLDGDRAADSTTSSPPSVPARTSLATASPDATNTH